MKAKANTVLMVVALMAYWIGLCNARAFYDPGIQRWLNRDPLMDAGSTVFDQMSQRTSSKLFRHEQRQPNGYEFVNNAPVIQFDLFGLWSPGLPYNVPPGPACDAYGCGSKGSALKWICNHAGNNPWANCVRGCLLADWNSSTGGYNSGIVSIHLACWELCAE